MTTGSSSRASVPVGAAVPSLVRWGMSSDADLVYRTIVTLGPRPARALSLELGLPGRRVDDALNELRAVGATVSVNDGRPSSRQSPVWVTRPPAHVVNSLRNRRFRPIDEEMQARTHQAVVISLAERAARVSGIPAGPVTVGGQLGEAVRYLPNLKATRLRLAELVAVERREHLTINTEQAFDAAASRAGWPLARKLIDRGVRVRVLSPPPADRDLGVDAAVTTHSGYAMREAPQVPMKLFIIDHRVAIFPADPRDFERGCLEISQPAVVRALVGLFERHWATAADPRRHGVPEVVLSERERELVALLALGYTDVSAAARMKISTRSVTYIVRALMDRLAVDNRFQLGLALGAAGAAVPPAPPSTKES